MSDRNRMIVRNLPLVKTIVGKFPKDLFTMACAEFEDLFSVGCIGLTLAVDRFDPTKEAAFSTYAVPYIRGEILKYLERKCYQGGIKIRRDDYQRKLRVWVYELDRLVSPELDSPLTYLDALEDRADVFADVEHRDWIESILSHLDKRKRPIIEGVYLQEMTQKEVARKQRVSEATVHRHHVAAMKQLKQLAASL